MKKIFLIIPLIIFLSSCGVRRYNPYYQGKDSVYFETVVYKELHDTVAVFTPVDSSVFNRVFTPDTSHLETDIALSEAWVDSSGVLNHTLENKLTPISVDIEIPVYTKAQKEYLTRTVIKEVEKHLTPWQNFCMVLGKIFLGVMGVGLVALILLIIKKFRIFGL